jgi:Family of unknown function (DUF6279)
MLMFPMLHLKQLISPYFKRTAVLLSVLALLGACSLIGTVYQNATSLAMYEIDSYFDLNNEQQQAGTLRTDAMMAWHRREVLPLYVVQLRSLAGKVEQGFTAQEVNDTMNWGTAELRRIASHTSAQQAELLTSLSAKQIAYFQKKLNKENAKYRKEWIDAPREEALELRVDKLMTWVERIYGNFNSEQRQRIRALSDLRAYEPQKSYEERVARETQLLNVIKTAVKDPGNQTAAQAAIANFVADLDNNSEYTQLRRSELNTLIAAISQIATPQQRLKAKSTLLGYANTFDNLSRGR